jgi:hypothetical protein
MTFQALLEEQDGQSGFAKWHAEAIREAGQPQGDR